MVLMLHIPEASLDLFSSGIRHRLIGQAVEGS